MQDRADFWDFEISPASPETWEIKKALTYTGKVDTWTVPVGFITDFATIPRALQWVLPKSGLYTPAAIVHDWFCSIGILAGVISSRDADGVFRRIMRDLGVPPFRRWLLWTGVRLGAIANPIRRQGWWRDLPRMLPLLVIALALLVVPTAVSALGRLTVSVVELIFGAFYAAGRFFFPPVP